MGRGEERAERLERVNRGGGEVNIGEGEERERDVSKERS
jgi:hypothetical protein